MKIALPPTYTVSFRFRKILVPVDGSDNSFRALELALDFAQRYGSRVTVLHVKPEGSKSRVREELITRYGDIIKSVEFKVREYNPQLSSPASEILKELFEESYDLVILGARGTTINENIQLGSVASSVIFNAPISVIIVR